MGIDGINHIKTDKEERTSVRIKISQHAEPGVRFAPDSWDNNINKKIKVTTPGGVVGQGTVTRAEVSKDGSVVELTIEMDLPETAAVQFHR